MYALLDRIRPELSSEFEVEIQSGLKTVELLKDPDSKVKIKASTGVLATWGIHHYLKYYCGCHFSWDTIRIKGNQNNSNLDFLGQFFTGTISFHHK